MSEPLSAFADIYYGKSPADVVANEGDVPVYGTGGVYGKASRSLFSGPAVIIPRKGSLSSPHYCEGPFWASDTTYAAIPKRGVDAQWLYYQLCQFKLESLNEATGVPSISRDWLAKSGLFPHDTDSQTTIARVLRAIDTQIEATEALISKQEQVRAGLMQDLFTRGADEHGQLRPPREEAPQLYHQTELGCLPKGWSVDSLSSYAAEGNNTFTNGPFGSNLLSSELLSDGVPVIYVRDISHDEYNRVSTACVSQAKANQLVFCGVRKGDVLIAKVGDPPCMAAPYLRDDQAIVTQDVMRLRPASPRDQYFLASFLNSSFGAKLVSRIVVEGTRSRVSLTEIKGLRVPVPTPHERESIGAVSSAALALIKSSRAELERLLLQKSGLMQDLLTGKVSLARLLERSAA